LPRTPLPLTLPLSTPVLSTPVLFMTGAAGAEPAVIASGLAAAERRLVVMAVAALTVTASGTGSARRHTRQVKLISSFSASGAIRHQVRGSSR
jgi:hypothetical protein